MAKKKKQQSIVKNILWRVWGAVLMLAAVLLVVSCLSYNPNDPSFHVVISRKATNFLGYFGAFWASVFVPLWGWAIVPFLIAPLLWGYQLLRGKSLAFAYWRILAFVLGTQFLTPLMAKVSRLVPVDYNIGGAVGVSLLRRLVSVGNRVYAFEYFEPVVVAVCVVFAFMAFNFAVGITYKSWVYAAAWVWSYIYRVVRVIGAAIYFLLASKKRIVEREDAAEVKEKPIRTRKEKVRKEPKLKEEPKVEEEKKFAAISKKSKERVDGYELPSVTLLSKPPRVTNTVNQKELDTIASDLEMVLQEFGVSGKIVKIRPGPVVTLYELEPAPGTKTARVIGLADDIARSMSVSSVRIAVVSGSNTIGIEMPNPKRETVWLRDLLENDGFIHSKNTLNVILGKNIGGDDVYADLAKMPHLLVAGTTGSGKSVGVNQMILSLLYKMGPEELKMIMIDPKMLEFSMYNGIPHLLTPVITDPAKAVVGLKWAVKEMEDRYRAMAQLNVRNITGYNQKLQDIKAKGEVIKRTVQTGFDAETGKPIFEEQELDLTPLPYIVIVVDEMADLMLVAGKEVEAAIQRLAQMARAAGLHLIMSTQRPSVDVITGTIKANFPTRISFQVTSKIDSRTILGEQGAEQLLGRGDMLYMPAGQRPLRVHGSFVPDAEIEKVVQFLKKQKAPEYVSEVTAGELSEGSGSSGTAGGGNFEGDEIYTQAVAIVQQDKKASTSYLQRKLRIGYNKAASIIDRMEEEGIVSKADHVGRREVL